MRYPRVAVTRKWQPVTGRQDPWNKPEHYPALRRYAGRTATGATVSSSRSRTVTCADTPQWTGFGLLELGGCEDALLIQRVQLGELVGDRSSRPDGVATARDC